MIEALAARLRGRVVVLGVGNSARGDDGAGPALAARIVSSPRVTIIDAGDAPESYLDVVAAAQPDTVLLVDAVELGARPGDVALLDLAQLQTPSSSHHASLALLMRYAAERTGADTLLLGIQPGHIDEGPGLSPEVWETVDLLAEALNDILHV